MIIKKYKVFGGLLSVERRGRKEQTMTREIKWEIHLEILCPNSTDFHGKKGKKGKKGLRVEDRELIPNRNSY